VKFDVQIFALFKLRVWKFNTALVPYQSHFYNTYTTKPTSFFFMTERSTMVD